MVYAVRTLSWVRAGRDQKHLNNSWRVQPIRQFHWITIDIHPPRPPPDILIRGDPRRGVRTTIFFPLQFRSSVVLVVESFFSNRLVIIFNIGHDFQSSRYQVIASDIMSRVPPTPYLKYRLPLRYAARTPEVRWQDDPQGRARPYRPELIGGGLLGREQAGFSASDRFQTSVMLDAQSISSMSQCHVVGCTVQVTVSCQ